jgi:tetratricopeptide (TPR) repeat protein
VTDRSRWSGLVLYLIGASLVLAASGVHNRLAAGEWVLTTANAGQNVYLGNNALNVSGEYQWLPFVDANPKHEQRDFEREAERRTGRPMSPREVSGFWFGQAWSWIRSQPGDWLRLGWMKLRVYWGAFEVPDNLDYYFYREGAPVLRLPIPGFGLVAPLGLLGALLALGRRGWPRLLLVYLVVYSLSVVSFFVFSRFRMVMMPALFVFAGHGAVELARRFRTARRPGGRRPALTAVGLLLALLCFVNLPVRAIGYSWSYRIASAIGLPTREETTALAHYNLGLVYAARAREEQDAQAWLGRAEQELSRALELDAGRVQFHVELGKVLARQQRNEEAIERYLAAERITPGDYRIAHSLGLLSRRLSDLAGAEEAFRSALRLAPRHAASAVQLGEVLLLMDRPAQAAEAFRRALGVAPNDARARAGLQAALERGGS